MRLQSLIIILSAGLTGCATLTVTYPVCGYSHADARDWQKFDAATKLAVPKFFGPEASFVFSTSKRTLTITGQKEFHEKFIPWLTVEACIPDYTNSTDRGAYVVCSAFVERAASAAITYALARKDAGAKISPYSDILRDMDKQFLGCQQDWPAN